MIKRIFQHKWYLQKHLDAPQLYQREEFLETVKQRGVSNRYLRHVDNVLIRVLNKLNPDKKTISLSELNQAALSASNEFLSNSKLVKTSPLTIQREHFNIAFMWFLHMGKLDDLYTNDTFFCKIYKKRHSRIKVLSYPLLQQRQSYLENWEKQGAATVTLQQISQNQLYAIDLLSLDNDSMITEDALQNAANTWMAQKPNNRFKNERLARIARRDFLTSIRNWLIYMNRYVQPQDTYPLKEKVTEYLNWLTVSKGCAKCTIAGRLSVLRHFMRTMSPSDLRSITPSTLDQYIILRKNDGLCRKSISAIISILRCFFKYGESVNWNSTSLSLSLKGPRIYSHEDVPSFVPWNVVQQILCKKKQEDGISIRDYAVLLLLSIYGLRVGEVINLKLKDIDWHNELLSLKRSKGCKPQIFPLLPIVGDAIIRYIKLYRYNENHSEYLFLRSFAPYEKLSPAAIGRMVRQELKSTGVKLRHYGPHSLRHGRATQLVNSGHSLKEVADILGHVRLNTTRIYAKVNLTSLREVANMNWEGLV